MDIPDTPDTPVPAHFESLEDFVRWTAALWLSHKRLPVGVTAGDIVREFKVILFLKIGSDGEKEYAQLCDLRGTLDDARSRGERPSPVMRRLLRNLAGKFLHVVFHHIHVEADKQARRTGDFTRRHELFHRIFKKVLGRRLYEVVEKPLQAFWSAASRRVRAKWLVTCGGPADGPHAPFDGVVMFRDTDRPRDGLFAGRSSEELLELATGVATCLIWKTFYEAVAAIRSQSPKKRPPPPVPPHLPDDFRDNVLTDEERRVFDLMRARRSIREIAQELGIREGEVERLRAAVIDKLNVYRGPGPKERTPTPVPTPLPPVVDINDFRDNVLTDEERRVFDLMRADWSIREIAVRLEIRRGEVEALRADIIEKLKAYIGMENFSHFLTTGEQRRVFCAMRGGRSRREIAEEVGIGEGRAMRLWASVVQELENFLGVRDFRRFPENDLTEEERRVFDLMRMARSTREIAKELRIEEMEAEKLEAAVTKKLAGFLAKVFDR